MNKLTKSLLLSGLATLPLFSGIARAADPAPPYTLAYKASLYSEYEYRGISQTSEKPAGQINIDYTHSSGFYLGTFVSNIQWLKDAAKTAGGSTNANIELDLFGGYRYEMAKDLTLDVGYLRYEYPSSGAFNPKPNTDELYAGVTYAAFNVKYSHSINDTFGAPNSKNTYFIETNWTQEIAPKLTANAQIARQVYKGTQESGFKNSDLSYTVYKLGLTYDLGDGLNAGGYVKDTNARKDLYTIEGKNWGKGRLVAFVSKSF
jgi:uncharacterized protein (TIGR02001 family)